MMNEGGWLEAVQKQGLHRAFFRCGKLLIFKVYFTGARCTYIYIYTCTLHLPYVLSF